MLCLNESGVESLNTLEAFSAAIWGVDSKSENASAMRIPSSALSDEETRKRIED